MPDNQNVDQIKNYRIKLHQRLVDQELYSKSYDEFEQQFSDPEKRHKMWKYLNKERKYSKDYEHFDQNFFGDLKKKEVASDPSSIGLPNYSDPQMDLPERGPDVDDQIKTDEDLAKYLMIDDVPPPQTEQPQTDELQLPISEQSTTQVATPARPEIKTQAELPPNERNPFKTLGKSAWRVIGYDMPAAGAATAAIGARSFENMVRLAEAGNPEVYEILNRDKSLSGKAKEDIKRIYGYMQNRAEAARNGEISEEQYAEDMMNALNQYNYTKGFAETPESKGIRKLQESLIKYAVDRKEKGGKFTKNVVTSLSKVNDPLDAINYVIGTLGETGAQIVPAAATMGASAFIQEAGGIYIDAIMDKAQETGMDIEEILDKNLDNPGAAAAFGLSAALLEKMGADEVVKSINPQSFKNALRSRAMDAAKAGNVEGKTELMQTILEQTGVNLSNEKELDNIDFGEVVESYIKGYIGGGGISAGGQAASSALKNVKPKNKNQDDQKDTEGARSGEPVREEAIQAEPEQESSDQAFETGGTLQKEEQPSELKDALESGEGISKMENTEVEQPETTTTQVEPEPVKEKTDDKPEENRKRGYVVRDGVKYTRQKPVEAAKGKEVNLEFSNKVSQPGNYAVIESDALQPSHFKGKRNNQHFIPDAQPKNRDQAFGQAGAKGAMDIAQNLDPEKIAQAPNPYSGAPTVNTRGEAIQGNSRADAIKQYWENYQDDPQGYKQYMIENAEQFGLNPEEIAGMKNPVLVRMLPVADGRAVELGNYDAKDIESGGKRRLDPKVTAKKLNPESKSNLVKVLTGSKGETLPEMIRDKASAIVDHLYKSGAINSTQLESIINPRTGEINAKGVEDVGLMLRETILEGGDTNLSELYSSMPDRVQKGLDKSIPALLRVKEGINEEVQNAIHAFSEFESSGIDKFGNWRNQPDMFNDGYSPEQIYSPAELAMAKMFAETKTQKEISEFFSKYARLTEGQAGDLFNPAGIKGIGKQEALKQLTGNEQKRKTTANKPKSKTSAAKQPKRLNQSGEAIRADGNQVEDRDAQIQRLKEKPLTHVSGVGMGANQAAGTYLSTEQENRYEGRGTLMDAEADISNPYVTNENNFFDIQRKAISDLFGEGVFIDDLSDGQVTELAKRLTKEFKDAGFDSLYFPQSETQEGELIVFDKGKVKLTEREAKSEKVKKKLNKAEQEFKDLWNEFGKSEGAMAGVSPKQFEIAGKLIAKGTEIGIIKFEQFIAWAQENAGKDFIEKNFDAFKAAYGAQRMMSNPEKEDLNAIAQSNVKDYIQQENESTTSTNLESDSQNATPAEQVGQKNVQPAGGENRPRTRQASKQAEGGKQSGTSVSYSDTTTTGKQSDTGIQEPGRGLRSERGVTEPGKPDGGKRTDDTRVRPDTGTNQPTTKDAGKTTRLSKEKRFELQKQAENIPYKSNDPNNVSQTLPMLLPEQQEDVIKAEARFSESSSVENPTKGILFTNGTGTGKSYVFLGVAKRYLKQGKKNILLVVPTDAKARDFVEDGKNVLVDITQLKDTKDAGEGVVVTTYANFRDNEALLKRQWDLVAYDESHKLMSNQSGTNTKALQQHRQLTNSPTQARIKARKAFESAFNKDFSEYNTVRPETKQAMEKYQQELIDNTRVMFLSATPFSYHKNISYGDGYLFTMQEGVENEGGSSYNSGTPEEQFYMQHFGYRMRYNKLTMPETGVDVNLMEREFHTWLTSQGSVSGRSLEIDQDYSREFVLIDDEIGMILDEGYNVATSEYRVLPAIMRKKWSWLYKNQLLESIKARQSIKRIEKHMKLGRKIVVSHSYNNAIPSHPFDLDDPMLLSSISEDRIEVAKMEIIDFYTRFPQYRKMNLMNLRNPITTIQEHFGEENTVVFNGTVPKKKRSANIKLFNDPDSNKDIMIVQMDAGKEGISLHDTLGPEQGGKQRALINLGLPYKPTDATQIEGRIYRLGNQSDAIIEYPVLHLDFEKLAYSEKINERVRTAENLAMGEQARNLEDSFKDGYANASMIDPNAKQGAGGKQNDRVLNSITPWDKAKTYYWARAKRDQRTKAREGKDYFATPEPLGLKMADWLYSKPDHDLLEPSAGHGAIARFFPGNTNNTFIEPSNALRADLSIKVDGKVRIEGDNFEDLHISNKFDGIAMNPPFGSGGKMAMEHIAKASKHLRDGSRLIAIIPDGPSMEKRFDQWMEGDDAKNLYVTGEISLPRVAFERAGTQVKSKVMIIDKQISEESVAELPTKKTVDLSGVENINDFFGELEFIDMPHRVLSRSTENQKVRQTFESAQESGPINKESALTKGVEEFKHTKTGEMLSLVKLAGRVERSDYLKLANTAKENNGYYSSYAKGFLFTDKKDAQTFDEAVNNFQETERGDGMGIINPLQFGIGLPFDLDLSGVKSFFQKYFTTRGHVPAKVLDKWLNADGKIGSIIKRAEYMNADFKRAMKKAFGKKPTTAQLNALDLAMKGKIDINTLPDQLREPVVKMRQFVDQLSERMIEEGVVSGKIIAKIDDNLGVYLTRSYQIHDDPARWRKFIEKNPKGQVIANKAKAFVRNQWNEMAQKYAERYQELMEMGEERKAKAAQKKSQKYAAKTDEDVAGVINKILFGNDGPLGLISNGKLGSKDLSILMKRKDIAAPIRELMGEYKDPMVNFNRSVVKMANLIEKHHFLSAVKQIGIDKFLFKEPKGKYAAAIAAEGSRVMAPLNGLYTTKEIADAFAEFNSSEPNPAWLQTYMKVLGAAKFSKTVLSLMTHIRNLVGNLYFVMANGHWRLNKMPEAVQITFNNMAKMDKKDFRERYARLLELGVVNESTNAGELKDIIADAINSRDMMENVFDNKLTRFRKKGMKAAASLYNAEDDLFKIFAFENEKARYQKAYPDRGEQQIEEMVSKIVRDTYPTYSMISRAVKLLRRNPLVGTFVSFPAEVVRVTYNTIGIAKTEISDPATRKIGIQRLSGLMMAASGVGTASVISQVMNDIDDDDDDALRRFVPPWSKGSNLIFLSKPQGGRAEYIDMNYTDPHGYLKAPLIHMMNEEDPKEGAIKALGSLFDPFLGTDMVTSKLVELKANKKQSGSPIYNEQDDIGSQAADMYNYMAQALEPGTFRSFRRIWSGIHGEKNDYGKVYDPTIEMIALFSGHRVEKVDAEYSFPFRSYRLRNELSDAKYIYTKELNKKSDVSEADLSRALRKANRARYKLLYEMKKDYEAALQLDSSPEKLKGMMKGKLSYRDIKFIMGIGEFVPIDNKHQKDKSGWGESDQNWAEKSKESWDSASSGWGESSTDERE